MNTCRSRKFRKLFYQRIDCFREEIVQVLNHRNKEMNRQAGVHSFGCLVYRKLHS